MDDKPLTKRERERERLAELKKDFFDACQASQAALEVETLVALMIDGTGARVERALSLLEEKDFAQPEAACVFRGLKLAGESGIPLSRAALVIESMRENGTWERLKQLLARDSMEDAMSWLALVTLNHGGQFELPAHIPHYAQRLRERRKKRATVIIAETLSSWAQDEQGTVKGWVAEAERLLTALAKLPDIDPQKFPQCERDETARLEYVREWGALLVAAVEVQSGEANEKPNLKVTA